MYIEKIKAIRLKTKNPKLGTTKTIGSLSLGSQSCYEQPSLLITYEDSEGSIEIQLSKNICEQVAEHIVKYSKSLPEYKFEIPQSNI